MNEITILQILAQTLTLEPGHIIDALITVVGFFGVLQLKDIKTTLKELRDLFLEHDRKITRLETKAGIRENDE